MPTSARNVITGTLGDFATMEPRNQTPPSTTSPDRASRLNQLWADHLKRRRIIKAPFLSLGVNVYGRSYTWAGVLIDRDQVGIKSQRTDTPLTEDDFHALVN